MPKSSKDTRRSSLWNASDELKRAPKGFDPDHPQVNWLRLKSYFVEYKCVFYDSSFYHLHTVRFTDAEVLADDFIDNVVRVARAAQPLIEM